MRAADHIVDFGPGPGVRGGEVVADGRRRRDRPSAAQRHRPVPVRQANRSKCPSRRRPIGDKWLRDRRRHGTTISRTSTSRFRWARSSASPACRGSGKSSLVNDILVEALRRDLNGGEGKPGEHDRIEGLEQLDKLIAIDQSPIGRTPRSNPATYIKLFDEIRDLYAQLPESKAPRLQAGPVQLQRRRRPLRGVRRQRLEPAGNGFSGRRLGHLPGVRRAPLQPRDAAGPLQGQEHRRRAGNGRAGGARALREHSRRSGTSCKRCTTWASTTSSSASRRRRSPAARRSASSWPASW